MERHWLVLFILVSIRLALAQTDVSVESSPVEETIKPDTVKVPEKAELPSSSSESQPTSSVAPEKLERPSIYLFKSPSSIKTVQKAKNPETSSDFALPWNNAHTTQEVGTPFPTTQEPTTVTVSWFQLPQEQQRVPEKQQQQQQQQLPVQVQQQQQVPVQVQQHQHVQHYQPPKQEQERVPVQQQQPQVPAQVQQQHQVPVQVQQQQQVPVQVHQQQVPQYQPQNPEQQRIQAQQQIPVQVQQQNHVPAQVQQQHQVQQYQPQQQEQVRLPVLQRLPQQKEKERVPVNQQVQIPQQKQDEIPQYQQIEPAKQQEQEQVQLQQQQEQQRVQLQEKQEQQKVQLNQQHQEELQRYKPLSQEQPTRQQQIQHQYQQQIQHQQQQRIQQQQQHQQQIQQQQRNHHQQQIQQQQRQPLEHFSNDKQFKSSSVKTAQTQQNLKVPETNDEVESKGKVPFINQPTEEERLKKADQALDQFFSDVLANLSVKMKTGMDEPLGEILDPVRLDDMQLQPLVAGEVFDVKMKQITVGGLSDFKFTQLESQLNESRIKISIHYPKLSANCLFGANGTMYEIFKVTGKGNATIIFNEVHARTVLYLTKDNGVLQVSSADQPYVDFSSAEILFRDEEAAEDSEPVKAESVATQLGPLYFWVLTANAVDKIDYPLALYFNKALKEFPLSDFLDGHIFRQRHLRIHVPSHPLPYAYVAADLAK